MKLDRPAPSAAPAVFDVQEFLRGCGFLRVQDGRRGHHFQGLQFGRQVRLPAPKVRVTRYSRWTEVVNPWLDVDRLPVLANGLFSELVHTGRPALRGAAEER